MAATEPHVSRWSRLRLRTKGLIIVTLPVVPLAVWALILGAQLVREGAAGTVRGLPPSERRTAVVWQYVIFFVSIGSGVAGLGAALVVGNGIRRRVDLLVNYSARLGRAEIPDDLDLGHDEIGELGRQLRSSAKLLREREEELRMATHSFERFFTLSHDMFCIARFDGYFERVNPSWERTLGYTPEELVAKPFLDWIHPDDRERTMGEAGKLAAGGVTVSFENRYRAKDGSYRWLLWASHGDPKDSRIYASARDITEARQATERLESLNAELRRQGTALQATNDELEAFSYSVSHDLRAPLRAIDGFSQVIEEDHGSSLDQSGRDAIKRVRAATKRMGLLIDDLINLSRLTRMEMQRTRVDLSAMAASVVADLRRREPDRQVVVTIAPGLLGHGDVRMLRIVLQNLIENAWKYTGRVDAPQIEVVPVTHADMPGFAVCDNGAGFDMKYAGKLFGAFQRLHSDREFQGTGIGLATVARIVHRHGGDVWAEGAVGAGATFGFTLGPEHEAAGEAAAS